jgi:predicted ATPase/DNA-binding CsgD family transcriptional regulator/DNA-binding XRE family transcriptional regulator
MSTGLTQEALAEAAGVSVRGISDLERGVRRAPHLTTVNMLADALALTPEDRQALVAAARRPPTARGERVGKPSRLPVATTPLIGRESDIAAVSALLAAPAVRLLTLTGVGGTGKTRLALAIAERMAPEFSGDVTFVSLAPLQDAAFVASAIAEHLGVRERAEQSLRDALVTHLVDQHVLLVLDNFEHVLPAAPLVADVLAACTSLRVLTTSRAALHLSGEYLYPVSPLALPAAGRLQPLVELGQVEAVRLFVERVQAVKPDFALRETNAPAVVEIVRRLDGLPLALELAAARVRVLSPAALLARLDQRLPLLTGGPQDRPDRQRTLRNTIAWSYDLLTSAEQELFRRLAVFAGGWTLEAAEAVATPNELLAVLEGMTALLDNNLVQGEEHDAEPRYSMLETIREFALEQLAATGKEDETRRRHACYFLHLGERLTPEIDILESLEQRRELIPEYDNLHLALLWFGTHDEVEALLRLTAMLAGEWLARGLLRDGLERIDRVLGRTRNVVSAARVQLLHAAGVMALYQGNHDRAAPFFEESLAVARVVGDPFLVGQSLAFSGWLSYRAGEYRRADEQLTEARHLLYGIRDPVRATLALIVSGDNAMAQEHFAQALRFYQQTIGLLQAGRYGWLLCDTQSGLAGAHYCLGDIRQAAVLYAESLRRAPTQNVTVQLVSALVGLAAVAAATGHTEVGARLLGAAEGLADSVDARLFPRDSPVRRRALAAFTTALGETRLAAELAAGRSLTMDQAIVEGNALLTSVRADSQEVSSRPIVAAAGPALTSRELDVLRLIVAGRRDQEIADTLYLSRRTIQTHVTHLFTKLGVNTRAEAAALAVRRGLA